MVDGKTVIARVKYESSDALILERPCEIIVIPPRTAHNKEDIPQLLFAPYLTIMGALKPLEVLDLKPAHVLSTRHDVERGIEDGYLELTSGIQLATSF